MSKKFLRLFCLSAFLALIAFATSLSQPNPVQAQTGWTLAWSDEFNGTGQPDAANWNYHVGNGWNNGLPGFMGWGNGEWEWYRPENCYQQGGNLVMRADYNDTATNIAGRDWFQRSCRITTDTKRSVKYGAIEARIQMPNNIGTWPAFWMMGDACDDTSTSNYAAPITYYDIMATNWSSCGEVDIMEHRNTESIIFNNLFWDVRTGLFPWAADPSNQSNPVQSTISNVAAFHTYRLEWTTTTMKWLIDGNVTKTQDITPANMEEFQKPFHIIMNLALSGQFTGNAAPNKAEFPLYMNVDYVRVYNAGGPTSVPPTTVPPTTIPPTTPPSTPSGGFTQIWSDEFNAAANTPANGANWLYDIGTCYPGCPAAQWGTGEIETMTNSTANVYHDGQGHLLIKPILSNGTWTSGRIETQRTDFAAPVGGVLRIEGSLQQPNVSGAAAAGYWPAFWTLGEGFRPNHTNWPGAGEIDIMEDINGLSSVFGTLHCGVAPGGPCDEYNGKGSGQRACAGCQTGFHTYAFEYDRSTNPEQIRWYLDNNNYFTLNANQVGDATAWNNATHHGFHIILNVAMGGSFPGAFGGGPTASTVSGVPMIVDYVRVLTKGGGGVTPTTPPPTFIPPTTPAGGDFTQGVTSLSGTSAKIWFRPTTTSTLVDVHYLVNGANQQNFRMTNNAGTWEQTVNGLAAGNVITYWFTYEKGGPLYDSAHFTYTHGGGSGPTPTATTPAADYTQGITVLGSSSIKIWFHPTTASTLVDVHYLVNGANQQNFRMTNNAGTWEQTVNGLAAGNVINYWFTYEKGGPLYDSPHYTFTK